MMESVMNHLSQNTFFAKSKRCLDPTFVLCSCTLDHGLFSGLISVLAQVQRKSYLGPGNKTRFSPFNNLCLFFTLKISG